MLVYYRINHALVLLRLHPKNQFSEPERMFVLNCFVYHISQCIHSKQTRYIMYHAPNNEEHIISTSAHGLYVGVLINLCYSEPVHTE